MKSIILAALAAFVASAAPALADEAAFERFKDQALAPTVQLDNGCSGSIISSAMNAKGEIETLVLTAKHCTGAQNEAYGADEEMRSLDPRGHFKIPLGAGDPKSILVAQHSGRNVIVGYRTFLVERKAAHGTYDIALLRLKDTETKFETVIELAGEDSFPAAGSETRVVGFPAGTPQINITPGLFAGREVNKCCGMSEQEWFKASQVLTGGNSGGPLIAKDANGNYKLIGVVSWGYRGSALSYFVPIDSIHKFLRGSARQVLEATSAEDRPTPGRH